MYTAVPQKIMAENPQFDFAIVGVFGDNEYPLWELLEEIEKDRAEARRHPRPGLAQMGRDRA